MSFFIFQCGGRYEPETLPETTKELSTVSKERQTNEEIKTIKEDQQVTEKTPGNTESDKPTAFQKGIASWYGGKFQGRRTANGEIYDKYKLTAAHKKLPFNSIVEVTNLNNNKRVIVRINDRGPFVKNRIIDLSKKAAGMIGMENTGTAPVSLIILNKKELNKKHKTKVFSNNITEQTQTDQSKSIEKQSTITQWFYIQAGAFSERINAEKVLSKIRRITDTKFFIRKSNDLFKVISEKITPKTFAEKISSDLKEYYIDTFVKSF